MFSSPVALEAETKLGRAAAADLAQPAQMRHHRSSYSGAERNLYFFGISLGFLPGQEALWQCGEHDLHAASKSIGGTGNMA